MTENSLWQPCPFCGGEPTYELIEGHESCFTVNGKPLMPPVSDRHIIECGCGCGLIGDSKEELLKRWNNRPLDQQLQAKEEEIEELKETMNIITTSDYTGSLEHLAIIKRLEEKINKAKDSLLDSTTRNDILQAKLQQAKEGLERLEVINGKNWVDGLGNRKEIEGIIRETLEIINKE